MRDGTAAREKVDGGSRFADVMLSAVMMAEGCTVGIINGLSDINEQG